MYFTVVIKDGFSFSENQSFYIITDSFNNKSFAFKKEFFFQVFNETSSIQFVCSKRSFLTKFKSLQSKIISFISNKVFSEKFSIVGVGYKCSLISQNIFQINIGLSHPVLFTIPKGIVVEISKDQTKAFFYSINYSLLKEFVSFICQQKQTDPYKGKGCFIISKVSVLPLKEGKRSKLFIIMKSVKIIFFSSILSKYGLLYSKQTQAFMKVFYFITNLRKSQVSFCIVGNSKSIARFFYMFKNESVTFLSKWVPGTLSNSQKNSRSFYPDILIVMGFKKNLVAILEANKKGIPVICFSNESSLKKYSFYLPYVIFCDPRQIKALWFSIFLFFTSFKK